MVSAHTPGRILRRRVAEYAGALALLALPFVFHVYAVAGSSMEPTYRLGDIVLAERATKYVLPLRRGEIIVMHNPHKREEVVLKRVVGLPNERVSVREHEVIVTRLDGEEERFAQETLIGGGAMGDNVYVFEMRLGPHDYFVLGDNRQNSLDSRRFGAVQMHDVIGRVLVRTPFVALRERSVSMRSSEGYAMLR